MCSHCPSRAASNNKHLAIQLYHRLIIPNPAGFIIPRVKRRLSFDWPLYITAIALSLLGVVYIYSATWVEQEPPGAFFSLVVKKQIVFLLLSQVVFFVLRRINWGLKPDSWLWFYIPVMIPLLLVLIIGHGRSSVGAQRWINLGVMDFQPSEFAKLGFILILAWLFSGNPAKARNHYLGALVVMLSMLALIILQPDLGTSLVFVFIFFVVSAFSRLPKRWLALTMLAFLLLSIPAFFLMKDYQKARLTAFINPEADPQGQGYHLIQSRIAVGSGGLTGKGFLRGTQSRGGFIPEIESDFIFALVAEEFGFVGCFILVLLYFLLLARILAIARDAKTPYEMYVCYGASALVFFHVFVGIGMTLGVTPITGLPLPFVSQGGSSLMTMWLLMAICQAVYTNSRLDFHRSR